MTHTAVQSSNIDSIGYDADTKQLAVKFKNGGTYHYHDVPAEEFERLVNSPKDGSYGKHLHAHIKGRYAATKKGD